ncbi:MAG: threonine-phosphate decarboxylase CobD [Actinomycetota bacterium]|nr:threonine-phosphate decarboxylase CobD [Actinomycetota bacterium]
MRPYSTNPPIPSPGELYPEYGHGGRFFKAVRESGAPGIIDFSASINPLGISKKALRAATDALSLSANYPDPAGEGIIDKLAAHFEIPPDCIVAANGSTEIIYLAPRALRPESALLHAPAFSEYKKACNAAGAKVSAVYGLSFKKEKFLNAIAKTKPEMIFLCNPNNPTGELIATDDILDIAALARRIRSVLVLDEAFADFCPGCSALLETARNPYLIVLRSLTKFYALAGLRIGFAACHPALKKKLLAFKEPWTVNVVAQAAAIASLADLRYREKTLELIAREKRYIEGRLEKASIWHFPSAANFYLARIKRHSEFIKTAFKKGVLIRDCSNFRGLAPADEIGYIRFAVKGRKENRMLMDLLENWNC